MVVKNIKDGIAEVTLPRWVLMGGITMLLSGAAAWFASMAKLDAVAESVAKIEPAVETVGARVVATEQDIALLKQQVASQADVSVRIGSLETQMSRQTAILEQVLIRLDGRGGG